MGLFEREKHYCDCCNAEVGSYDTKIQSESNEKFICSKCKEKINSKYIKENYLKGDRYSLRSEEMKIVQNLYTTFSERKQQFVTDYYEDKTLKIYIDKLHGWFVLNQHNSYISKGDIQKFYEAIEIYSVDDVATIEYGIQKIGDPNAAGQGIIYFRFKKCMMPVGKEKDYPTTLSISVPAKTWEMEDNHRKRITELIEPLKQYFPKTTFITVEEEARLAKASFRRNYHAEMKEDIEQLMKNRDQLNSSIEMIALSLPDKCRTMARRYLALDEQLSNNIDRLQKAENFPNNTAMRDCKDDAIGYQNEMSRLFNDMFLHASKNTKKA